MRKNNNPVGDMSLSINKTLQEHSDMIEKGVNFINNQPHKWYYTTSFDGIKLAGRYYDNSSNRTIFLFHGYRSSAQHDFSCAVEMYYKMGFNVFLADQRAHGKSEGKLITFGIKESRDVHSWLEFVNAKFSPSEIVISGISMGATTVLLSLDYDMPNNVQGVIADCGFTSPVDIIEKVGRDMFKINTHFFMPFLNFACKVFGNFSITERSTLLSVKKSKIPILFIHGEKDDFVPCEMSKKAYELCQTDGKIFLSKEAGHGVSFLVDNELLVHQLKEFLEFCLN